MIYIFIWSLDRWGAFDIGLSEANVTGRPADSHIFDPCSIFEADGVTVAGDQPAFAPSHSDDAEACVDGEVRASVTGLLVSTAESRAGWFEPQPFVTGLYRLTLERPTDESACSSRGRP